MGITTTILNGLGLYTKGQFTGVVKAATAVAQKAEEVQGIRSIDGFGFGHLSMDTTKYIRKEPVSPFKILRLLRKSVPLIGICVSAIKREMSLSDWSIIVQGKELAMDTKMKRRIEQLLMYTNKNQDNFRMLMQRVIEDILVLDAGVIEKVSDLSGMVRELYHVDGSTIQPNINAQGEYNPDKAYVQVINNQEKVPFALNEIVYIMQNPESDIEFYGYGMSPIEQVRLAVEATLNADLYNINQLKENNIPAGLLDLGDMTSDEVKDFKTMWDMTASGNFPQIKFLFGGKRLGKSSWTPFKSSSREMEYMKYVEWLSRLILASFGLSGMDANIVHDVNKASAEVQKNVSQSRGVESLKRVLEEYITREVILEGFGVENMKFEFSRPKTISPKEQAEIDKIYIEGGKILVDEARIRDGEPTLAEAKRQLYGEGDWDNFGNPVAQSIDTTKAQELAWSILSSRKQYLQKLPTNN